MVRRALASHLVSRCHSRGGSSLVTHRPFVALTAATLVLSSACGDGPTGPATSSGDQLTASEIGVVSAILVEFLILNVDLYEPLPGPSAVPYGDLYDDTIDRQFTCGAGVAPHGTVSVQGTITGDFDQATGAVLLDITAEADFQQCEYGSTSDDWIRLTSMPTVTYHAFYDLESDQVQTVDVDAAGEVGFEISDGRSGTCVFDVSYDHVLGPEPVAPTVTGQGCGSQVDYGY